MANERTAIAMSPEEIRSFLAAPRTAVLVTLAADGMPEPVGMWYVLDDDGVMWMRTYGKSQKAVNLRRDPRAAVLVEAGAGYDELVGVRLSGRMELVDDVERICDVFAGLMVRYQGLDPEYVDAAREGYRARAPKQVAMRLDVAEVVSWDHRKLAAARES